MFKVMQLDSGNIRIKIQVVDFQISDFYVL